MKGVKKMTKQEKLEAARKEMEHLENLIADLEDEVCDLKVAANQALTLWPEATVEASWGDVFIRLNDVTVFFRRYRNCAWGEVEIVVEAYYSDGICTPDDIKNLEEVLYHYLDVKHKLEEMFGATLRVLPGDGGNVDVYLG